MSSSPHCFVFDHCCTFEICSLQVCKHLESQYIDLDVAMRPMLKTHTASKVSKAVLRTRQDQCCPVLYSLLKKPCLSDKQDPCLRQPCIICQCLLASVGLFGPNKPMSPLTGNKPLLGALQKAEDQSGQVEDQSRDSKPYAFLCPL